jgi:hypothetical protein
MSPNAFPDTTQERDGQLAMGHPISRGSDFYSKSVIAR